ncbi:MAG: ParB/RepB/Spo0J family partition protein [Clostridia bacterium]|nr:ParB/RepB/Spo0J family partition protein [Clostridia bacterium]
MTKKSGLGRGLSSLLEETLETGTGKVHELSVLDIEPNPKQPRKNFDQEALRTLADSISEVGVLSPILVRQKENGLYEIIAGERRWRASKLAGKKKIPAIVKKYETKEVMEIALIENLQREDLNPFEEAMGYQTLKEQFGFTQEEIAKRVSKSRSTVANIMRILNLPDFVVKEIKNGKVSVGHAKALSSLESDEMKKLLLYEIVKNEISVREAEELAKKLSEKKRPNMIRKTLKKDPNLIEVETQLTNKFGTKVQIKSGKIKSKIEIEYYSQDDLKRIVDKLF